MAQEIAQSYRSEMGSKEGYSGDRTNAAEKFEKFAAKQCSASQDKVL
jgi:hypothetical protein